MNSLQSKYSNLIEKDVLEDDELKLVNKIIDHYPYFQSARLSKFKHNIAAEELEPSGSRQVLALQTFNREYLYKLYNSDFTSKTLDENENHLIDIPGFSFSLTGKVEKAEDDDPIILGVNLIDYESVPAYDISKTYKIGSSPIKNPNRTTELIDDFLVKSKSKKRIPLASDNVAFSNQPVEVPKDLVSETLAKIYLKQEKYLEAIEVYEKLILIVPEKKSIFARSISEIKSKIE